MKGDTINLKLKCILDTYFE